MAPIAETDPDFVFQGLPPIEEAPPDQVRAQVATVQSTDPFVEWSAEDDEAIVDQRVHEARVLRPTVLLA